MAAKYMWVVTKEVRRWKGMTGRRHSETRTFIAPKRNAQRRTTTKGVFGPRRTITEEWRLVDTETRRVLDLGSGSS